MKLYDTFCFITKRHIGLTLNADGQQSLFTPTQTIPRVRTWPMENPPSPFPTARPSAIPASARPNAQEADSQTSALGGANQSPWEPAAAPAGGQLALRAGISRSTLSRIERGLVSLSVQTLGRIAEGLGVPVARFFSDQHDQHDRHDRHDLSYVPAGKGIVVDRHGAAGGFQYELLGHPLSGNLFVEPYLVTLGAEADAYSTFQHPGISSFAWWKAESPIGTRNDGAESG